VGENPEIISEDYLSPFSQVEQTAVISAMESYGIKPSLSQAVRLKKHKQAGELTPDTIDEILSESKKPQEDDTSEDKELSVTANSGASRANPGGLECIV